MKRVILSLTALAMVAMVFTACDREEKTNEELLTISKGWKLKSAISTPEYTNSDGVTSANLFESWFSTCELNDVLYFNKSKATEVKHGCEDKKTKQTTGTWSFQTEDPLVLNFRIHFFEDEDGSPVYSDVDVKELTEEVFKYNYTWENESGTRYIFTMTYIPAK